MLIDTHTHLFDDRFASDLPAVLARAEAAGVERVMCLGIDRESSGASVRIANTHARVVAAGGIPEFAIRESWRRLMHATMPSGQKRIWAQRWDAEALANCELPAGVA